MSDGQTKTFGKSQRVVPADKAQKWYPVDDQSQPKKVSTPYTNRRIRGGYTTGKVLPRMIATIAPIF
jgi:large subunit ribosomal protein L6e